MKCNKYVVVLFVLSCLLASPTISKADTIFQVSTEFELIGNPVCGGVACTETIDLSFQMSPLETSGFLVPVFSNVQISGSGALGAANVNVEGDLMGGPDGPMTSFIGTMYLYAGSEIDFFYSVTPSSTTGYDFNFGPSGGFFYSCGLTCAYDFTNGTPCLNQYCDEAPIQVISYFQQVTYFTTQVPEPPASDLTAAGLVLFLPLAGFFLGNRQPFRRGRRRSS